MIKAFIDLPYSNYHGQIHNWFYPLENFPLERYAEYGIELTSLEQAEVIVCFEFNYLKYKDIQLPKVYMYGHDEAALLWETRYFVIKDPLVKSVVCPNFYRDYATQKMPHLESTRHGAITYELSNVFEKPNYFFAKDLVPKCLDDNCNYHWLDLPYLNKVKVFGSMMWHDFYGYCHDEDHCEPHRPIDVNLLGKSAAYDRWSVRKHRLDCLKAVNNLDCRISKVVSGTNSYQKEEHIESLRLSKICIAPWGYGETTGRDFQGVLTGSVVIKPNSGYIKTNPDFYDGSWKTILWCKPDFSDLPEIVDNVLTNWDSHWSSLVQQEQVRMSAIHKNCTLIDDFTGAIKDAVK